MLAPTGTIGFMMDSDTTGIEPDLALVKYKKLVGGGMIKIVQQHRAVGAHQARLLESEVNAHRQATSTPPAPSKARPPFKAEHLAVFDCSFKPAKGPRSISYMGHIKMIGRDAAVHSGAISKTVNLPQDCSVDDIAEAYMRAGVRVSRPSPSTATTPRAPSR